MSLNIKSTDACRLDRELAELQGISLTAAVTDALRDKLDRQKHCAHGRPLSEELLEIGKRCAAHKGRHFSHTDIRSTLGS
jgi:antitoxin VapB